MSPTRSLKRIVLAAAVSAVALGPSCHGERGINVILVTIDTLRDDHCSVSGYARDTTPGLVELAGEGTRVELAYAPTATTGPTHASILTGLYPIAHGVLKNGMSLRDDFTTVAETLREQGYATGAVVSSFVLDAKFGYAQGFDVYDDDFDPAHATIERKDLEGHVVEGAFDQRADATTGKALRLLERLAGGGKPFFMFVHYFDPHAPYVPPDRWAARFRSPETDPRAVAAAIESYDAEIGFADDEIGALLRFLGETGQAENTLVVVTADHGEGLMQRGHMHHGVHIYEEAVRVPLLFRLPGRIPTGGVLGGPVELNDLFPTILELAGVAAPNGMHGRSLAAALAGEAHLDPGRPIHLHRRHYEPGLIGEIPVAGERFGVRVGQWKYIEGDNEASQELYDLKLDPGELANVFEEFPEIARQMGERIAAWKTAYGRDTTLQDLSPEDIERLKALGYVE